MFGLGFGGQTFQRTFNCYSLVNAPKNFDDNVIYGGKILLPPRALEILAGMNIMYPMLFELTNNQTGLKTFCSVIEFTAEEGRIYLPPWMMEQLLVTDGNRIEVKSVTLPLGRFVKIQPQHENFLEISNPKAVLENGLRNFACLNVGDTISIKYNKKIYQLKVLETKPHGAISIIEADIEVDFAPPPGYVEPSYKSKEIEEPEPMEDVEESNFAFSGSGQRLNGKPVPIENRKRSASSASLPSKLSPSTSPSPSRSPNPYATMGRSSSPRQGVNFGQFSSGKNPAPLSVPANKLVFGTSSLSQNQTPNGSPKPSSLTSSLQQLKNSNSGSSLNSSSSASVSSGSTLNTSFTPFSGSGQSLRASKQEKQ